MFCPSTTTHAAHSSQPVKTMAIEQLGDLDHEKLITAGLLLQAVRAVVLWTTGWLAGA